MKKGFMVSGIVLGALLLVVFIIGFLFWFAFGGGIYFLPNPPKPEITYGEFPFKLTYELNNEVKVIEDAVICEFDGYIVEGENGKYRKWKAYLKSGNERVTLLDLRPMNDVNEFGQTMLELYFYWGNAEYYMGDNLDNRCRESQDFAWIEYMYQNTEGVIGGSAFKAKEAYEKYKIRLINWEAASPIKNNFK